MLLILCGTHYRDYHEWRLRARHYLFRLGNDIKWELLTAKKSPLIPIGNKRFALADKAQWEFASKVEFYNVETNGYRQTVSPFGPISISLEIENKESTISNAVLLLAIKKHNIVRKVIISGDKRLEKDFSEK